MHFSGSCRFMDCLFELRLSNDSRRLLTDGAANRPISLVVSVRSHLGGAESEFVDVLPVKGLKPDATTHKCAYT